MQPDPTNEQAQREIEALGNRVAQETAEFLASGRSSKLLENLIRSVHGRADSEIEEFVAQKRDGPIVCRAGCSWCCNEIVFATALEIVAIYDHIVQTFSQEDRAYLEQRLSDYEEAMADKRDKPFTFVRLACPLLVDDKCSIYPSRPLSCRGKSSNDAEVCRMWKESPGDGGTVQSYVAQKLTALSAERGLMYGSQSVTGGTTHEVPRCLRMLLNRPELRVAVLDGSFHFPKEPPLSRPKVFPPDTTSISTAAPSHPTYVEALRLATLGKWTELDRLLPDGNLFLEFAKLRAPSISDSYDQIIEFRHRMESALDRLAEMNLNPLDALTALAAHTCDTLPYQGLSVRALLEKQGRFILDKIISKIYPHLCAPIEAPRKPGPFRLGYISGALVLNNGNRWALGWARNHGSDIETYAINLGPQDIGSRIWERDVRHYYCLHGNVQRIAEFIRSLDLDCLIVTDLGARALDYVYFSMRLARVQCTAWGVPTTSGLPNMDYYLTSDGMEPENAESEYTEQLVRLPRSGLCHPRPKANFWPGGFKRTEVGFFPFMAQNIRKWTPQRDCLLKRVADMNRGPLRFMSQMDEESTRAFSQRLSRSCIPHELLPVTFQRGFANYLHSADVSFDPPDWSGGNTTIEALTYGTPVVTLPGTYMRGRHSVCFLTLANAPALIAEDEDDYLDLIFNHDRRHEATRNLDADALYDDKGAVAALDQFLLGTISC